MSDDLYEKAQAAFWTDPRPDWKRDMAYAYGRMEAASDEEARRRWANRVAEAYLPLAFYVAWKHSKSETRRRVMFSQRAAFDCALSALPRALSDFEPDKSPTGIAGLSSYVAQLAEWEILQGLYTHVRYGKVAPQIELDAYENEDCLDMLADTDDIDVCMRDGDMMDIIRGVISKLGPADAFLASSKLLDGMTWQEIADAGRARGGRGYERAPDTWAYRWYVLRRRFADALRAAGYDETGE